MHVSALAVYKPNSVDGKLIQPSCKITNIRIKTQLVYIGWSPGKKRRHFIENDTYVKNANIYHLAKKETEIGLQ